MQKDFQKTDNFGKSKVQYWLSEGDPIVAQQNYTGINKIHIFSWPEDHELLMPPIALWMPKGFKDRTAYLDLDTGHD